MADVPYPGATHLYYETCLALLDMDFMQADQLYAAAFYFVPTDPYTQRFAQFGLDDSNFLVTTGSLTLMAVGTVIWYLCMRILNWLAKKGYRLGVCRKVGLYARGRTGLRAPLLTLLLDGYIDCVLAAALNCVAIARSAEAGHVGDWFDGPGNLLCVALTVSVTIGVTGLPLHIWNGVGANFGRLHTPDVEARYGVYYAEYKSHRLDSARYASYYMGRRFT